MVLGSIPASSDTTESEVRHISSVEKSSCQTRKIRLFIKFAILWHLNRSWVCTVCELSGGEDIRANKNQIKICRDPGSNRGPLDLQSNALPTELSRLCKASERHKFFQVPHRESIKSIKKDSTLRQFTGDGGRGGGVFSGIEGNETINRDFGISKGP